MISVDYAYYTDEYRGTSLSEEEFTKYFRRADRYIYSEVGNKVQELEEGTTPPEIVLSVKDCYCAVADLLAEYTSESGVASNKVTSSETVGPWTVTYATGSKATKNPLQSQVHDLCMLYLAGIGIMCSWC